MVQQGEEPSNELTHVEVICSLTQCGALEHELHYRVGPSLRQGSWGLVCQEDLVICLALRAVGSGGEGGWIGSRPSQKVPI